LSNQDTFQFDISEDGFDELFKRLGINEEPKAPAAKPAAEETPAKQEPVQPPKEQPSQDMDGFLNLFSDAKPAVSESKVPEAAQRPAAAPIQPENQPAEEKMPEKPRQSARKADDKKKEESQSLPWPKAFALYLHDVAYLIAAVVVIFLLLFRVVVVSGTSMNDTLYDGDFLLLVSNVFYKQPKAGDVIVASKDTFDNGAPIVKRVIATEGQLVDIDFNKGIVYVDGTALEEPYTKTLTTMYEGVNFPLRVAEGCIFVLGDNRGDSKDSRSPDIGQIDTRQVVGKVIFLFLPGTNRGNEKFDLGRIGVIS